MRKFTFIGAGSLDFTRDLVRDLMTYPAFDDCELMLMDINEKRLSYAKQGIERIVKAGGHHAVVKATTDRREALKDADGVLITILQGGVEVWRHDIEIPKKYGVDICVGDTRGPSGIFRFLRTAPVLLSIIRTPLHEAAGHGHADVVKTLLEAGANPNVQDINKATPLHRAEVHGHDECARLLRKAMAPTVSTNTTPTTESPTAPQEPAHSAD